MFTAASFDPDTLDAMTRAFNEAWVDIQAMAGPRPLDAEAARSVLARRILAAAAHGERDPRRLKLIAMGLIA